MNKSERDEAIIYLRKVLATSGVETIPWHVRRPAGMEFQLTYGGHADFSKNSPLFLCTITGEYSRSLGIQWSYFALQNKLDYTPWWGRTYFSRLENALEALKAKREWIENFIQYLETEENHNHA